MNKIMFLGLFLLLPASAMAQKPTTYAASVQICTRPHDPTSCPAKIIMTKDQLQNADEGQLVAWLTSRGIGRRMFLEMQMPLEELRTMALRHLAQGE